MGPILIYTMFKIIIWGKFFSAQNGIFKYRALDSATFGIAAHTHIHTLTHTHAHAHAQAHAHAHSLTHARTHARTHTSIHPYGHFSYLILIPNTLSHKLFFTITKLPLGGSNIFPCVRLF